MVTQSGSALRLAAAAVMQSGSPQTYAAAVVGPVQSGSPEAYLSGSAVT